jgi:hypothetical protein
MTISVDSSEFSARQQEQERSADRAARPRRVAAIVLAVVALGLVTLVAGAFVLDDDSAAPTEVTVLLDEFATAYATEDTDLFGTIVTDDYTFTEDFYSAGEPTPDFSAAGPLHAALDDIATSTWRVERLGDPIVVGDGPWFVSVGESWTDPFNRADGAAVYVVVDDQGTPKISRYFWAGVKIEVQPDFDR